MLLYLPFFGYTQQKQLSFRVVFSSFQLAGSLLTEMIQGSCHLHCQFRGTIPLTSPPPRKYTSVACIQNSKVQQRATKQSKLSNFQKIYSLLQILLLAWQYSVFNKQYRNIWIYWHTQSLSPNGLRCTDLALFNVAYWRWILLSTNYYPYEF